MAGILEQVLGGMVAGNLGRRARRRGGGSMVMNGLLIALAAKAAHQYMRQRGQDRSFDPRQAPAGGGLAQGGAPGGLSGGLGGVLGGLGGAGALGALLNQLRQRGLGNEVDSWVRPGPNQSLQPQQLAQALDEDTLEQLSEETGMPRQALLSELSQTLPEAVDELTPEGHEPSDDELSRIAGSA